MLKYFYEPLYVIISRVSRKRQSLAGILQLNRDSSRELSQPERFKIPRNAARDPELRAGIADVVAEPGCSSCRLHFHSLVENFSSAVLCGTERRCLLFRSLTRNHESRGNAHDDHLLDSRPTFLSFAVLGSLSLASTFYQSLYCLLRG